MLPPSWYSWWASVSITACISRKGLYFMLVLFCMSVAYSISMIVREMIRRKNMLETMAATDMLHCSSHNKIFYQLNINGLSNFKNVTANDLETRYSFSFTTLLYQKNALNLITKIYKTYSLFHLFFIFSLDF